MKKISILAAALAVGAASLVSAEGFNLSGYVRSGISMNTKGESFSNAKWLAGDFFGGASRVRMNLDWDNTKGGATFRYQKDGAFTDDNWFDSSNIKYAMAYANFCDGKVIVEGGKLFDRYTRTGGFEDATFGDDVGAGLGARLVLNPVKGLYVAVSAADAFAEKYIDGDSKVTDGDASAGDVKFNGKLFGVSAKYTTDNFFVSAGAHLAKYYYGSFGFTGVENLKLVLEAYADYRTLYEYEYEYETDKTTNTKKYVKTEYDEKVSNNILFVPYVEYTGIENLGLAFFGYISVADDACFAAQQQSLGNYPRLAELVPAVSYLLTDVVRVSCEADIFIPKDWDEDKYGEKAKSYTLVVPSVTFSAGEKASVHVYAAISSDKDYAPTTFGAGVQYNF